MLQPCCLPDSSSLLMDRYLMHGRDVMQRTDYLKHFWEWYIIYMKNCMNCSFTGGGRVDGRANLWVTSVRSFMML